MPFSSIAKMGKSRKRVDVLKETPGMQDRRMVQNTVLEVIKERRTVRKYRKQNISDSDLNKILEAARYAPSAGNQQPWEFVVIRDELNKKRISYACFDQAWIAEAPVIIVVATNTILSTSKYGHRGDKLYGVQATAAAIENMLIAAESLGIASAWIGAFSERAVSILTACPEHVRPCAVLTFGHSDEKPIVPSRQELKEFVHQEHFGKVEVKDDRNHEIF
ncbi:MAG: nitroreductase family protein [Nanoarchaeota archaeon]|nr:nitroreductase family protein [Nanoarchaeota archaeon]MBU4124021.1 nitroreductase family protein [Nanoarchaeota archaeon]